MKNITLKLTYFLLFMPCMSFAATSSFEIFASNNTNQIDTQTAYQRLEGEAQQALENSMISVMQKNHIEQGRFNNILGTYQLAGQGTTADNSERFDMSPYQHLSDEKVFSLAKQLAVLLNQESVAVLIPDRSVVGEITLNFTNSQPGIAEAISLISQKLPANYHSAFSLHLMNGCGGYANAKVASVEWLGSHIKVDEVKNAFPSEGIEFKLGKAFLVYQNGKRERL